MRPKLLAAAVRWYQGPAPDPGPGGETGHYGNGGSPDWLLSVSLSPQIARLYERRNTVPELKLDGLEVEGLGIVPADAGQPNDAFDAAIIHLADYRQ